MGVLGDESYVARNAKINPDYCWCNEWSYAFEFDFPYESVIYQVKRVGLNRDGINCSENEFIETVERTNETDWIYGCRQHENILIVLITSNAKASILDIVSKELMELMWLVENVHRMINNEFGYAFTII